MYEGDEPSREEDKTQVSLTPALHRQRRAQKTDQAHTAAVLRITLLSGSCGRLRLPWRDGACRHVWHVRRAFFVRRGLGRRQGQLLGRSAGGTSDVPGGGGHCGRWI